MLCYNSTSLKPRLQSHAKADKLWMKVYIFVAWALDTIHEVFLLKTVYVYLVKDIVDPLLLEQEIS